MVSGVLYFLSLRDEFHKAGSFSFKYTIKSTYVYVLTLIPTWWITKLCMRFYRVIHTRTMISLSVCLLALVGTHALLRFIYEHMGDPKPQALWGGGPLCSPDATGPLCFLLWSLLFPGYNLFKQHQSASGRMGLWEPHVQHPRGRPAFTIDLLRSFCVFCGIE